MSVYPKEPDPQVLGPGNLQLDSTLPGTHTKNQAEVDVLASLRDVVIAEKLNDLEELLQVQVLGARDDIDHVVKLMLLVL